MRPAIQLSEEEFNALLLLQDDEEDPEPPTVREDRVMAVLAKVCQDLS
jgi:hypothetical protein